jgi:hypothetical protein
MKYEAKIFNFKDLDNREYMKQRQRRATENGQPLVITKWVLTFEDLKLLRDYFYQHPEECTELTGLTIIFRTRAELQRFCSD